VSQIEDIKKDIKFANGSGKIAMVDLNDNDLNISFIWMTMTLKLHVQLRHLLVHQLENDKVS